MSPCSTLVDCKAALSGLESSNRSLVIAVILLSLAVGLPCLFFACFRPWFRIFLRLRETRRVLPPPADVEMQAYATPANSLRNSDHGPPGRKRVRPDAPRSEGELYFRRVRLRSLPMAPVSLGDIEVFEDTRPPAPCAFLQRPLPVLQAAREGLCVANPGPGEASGRAASPARRRPYSSLLSSPVLKQPLPVRADSFENFLARRYSGVTVSEPADVVSPVSPVSPVCVTRRESTGSRFSLSDSSSD